MTRSERAGGSVVIHFAESNKSMMDGTEEWKLIDQYQYQLPEETYQAAVIFLLKIDYLFKYLF